MQNEGGISPVNLWYRNKLIWHDMIEDSHKQKHLRCIKPTTKAECVHICWCMMRHLFSGDKPERNICVFQCQWSHGTVVTLTPDQFVMLPVHSNQLARAKEHVHDSWKEEVDRKKVYVSRCLAADIWKLWLQGTLQEIHRGSSLERQQTNGRLTRPLHGRTRCVMMFPVSWLAHVRTHDHTWSVRARLHQQLNTFDTHTHTHVCGVVKHMLNTLYEIYEVMTLRELCRSWGLDSSVLMRRMNWFRWG